MRCDYCKRFVSVSEESQIIQNKTFCDINCARNYKKRLERDKVELTCNTMDSFFRILVYIVTGAIFGTIINLFIKGI